MTAVLALAPTMTLHQGNSVNDSFSKSKAALEEQVYFDHRETLYCGAQFDAHKNVTLPAGFKTDKYPKRAMKVEWEHVVAAENFGRSFKEWREGHPSCVNSKGKPFKGRRCAELANKEYRLMQADMYKQAIEILTENGFEHYEISNFSLEGFNSRHNLNYWDNNTYYGFGAAAHGYVGGVRYFNKETLEDYIKNPLIRFEEHLVTPQEKLEEEIFLGFRRGRGINTEKINAKFDINFENKYQNILQKYIQTGHILKTKYGYKFSDEGFMLSNFILAEFLE